MKNRFTAIILSVLLVSGLAFVPAYGQGVPFTVTTDAISYDSGDNVIISGTTSGVSGDVVLTLFAPNGNRITVAQAPPNSDGKYSESVTLNEKWSNGEYVIKAYHGSLKDQTSFIIGDVAASPDTERQLKDNELRVSGTDGTILFEITGGSINSVTPMIETTTLVIEITANDDGELTLTIPRSVLDATGEYPDFIVFIDSEEKRDFEEISTDSQNRVLKIPFLAGDETIEIVGTFIIPEFGTIAIIVLAIAIMSIIGLSFRSRLTIPSSI